VVCVPLVRQEWSQGLPIASFANPWPVAAVAAMLGGLCLVRRAAAEP
jgi:hypothetical protein